MSPVETIVLAHPVEINGVTHTSITLRPLTLTDVAAFDRINARAEVKAMKLVCRVTGLNYVTIAAVEEANDGTLKKIDSFLFSKLEGLRRGR